MLLNSLLNVPAFIGNFVQSDFFSSVAHQPYSTTFFTAPHKSSLLVLVGDFIVLFSPLFLLGTYPRLKKVYITLSSIVYLLLLYYSIYYAGYQNLYSVHPIFQNDWIIAKEVMPTFFNELSVKKGNYLLIVLAFFCLSILLGVLFAYAQQLFSKIKNQSSFWITSVSMLLLLVMNVQYNIEKKILNEENKIKNEFKNNAINWIYPAIQISSTLHREDHLAHLKKRWIYDLYKTKKLVKKPNIYLLFIESYGAVATLSDYCSEPFTTLSDQLEGQLKEADWHISSNYTKSPVIGGRSWLALTTAMVGARIEDQIQYNGLLHEHQTFPHLIDYLNTQDYETVRVSTMSSKNIDTLTMITIPNLFWGFDQRLLFSDIPYKGFQYDYYGGIPDQYTLSYIEEAVLQKAQEPYFMTFITMSSHGPWSNPPPIVSDWKSLDTLLHPYPNGRPPLSMHISQYWESMEYELKILTNFILKYGDEDSVFIILGDHNPAGLEWKLFNKFNKWATPIHVISKDSAFVNSFHQHGFTEGMQVDTSQFTIMRHMGLYSLLTRQLLENYGEEGVVLPEYLPWGLDLNK